MMFIKEDHRRRALNYAEVADRLESLREFHEQAGALHFHLKLATRARFSERFAC